MRAPRLIVIACLLIQSTAARAQTKGPVNTSKGVVVSVSAPASEVGASILGQGGNAIDAAVATAFALAVTYPEAGNIGGGGYLLYCPKTENDAIAFDFREVAPAAATADMFVSLKDRTPYRRVGVPGTVAGLALAHDELGSLEWKKLIEPAISLASNGFLLDAACAASLADGLLEAEELSLAEFGRVYGKPGGGKWKEGDRLVQPELAGTLTRIANLGRRGFYAGETAELLVEEMKRGGGLITQEDLTNYQPLKKTPLRGTYRGFGILCMPPSSSGGTTLIEALNILEPFELSANSRWEPRTTHLMVEAMKRAYRDRARHLGDPAFVQIPDFLLSKEYARKLARQIDLEHSTPSEQLAGDIQLTSEGNHTTHLSVVDDAGTGVSLTYTLETRFGSAVVVKGAGFILNDEMNDFVWVPGVTDEQGGIGTAPNRIAPGKRMLSSMCPTIVTKGGKPILVTGSPGGRTIINTVLAIIINYIDFGMSAREAVDAPRIHHQWFPDTIHMESTLIEQQPQLIASLKEIGHRITPQPRQGDAHTIWIDPISGRAEGIPDHRISGKAATPELMRQP